jgi:hypothetical protein
VQVRIEHATPPVNPEPATLDERLRVVRSRRLTSRIGNAGRAAAWVAILTALVVVLGGGVLLAH